MSFRDSCHETPLDFLPTLSESRDTDGRAVQCRAGESTSNDSKVISFNERGVVSVRVNR